MVKTAATASARELFALLEKSGLIDDRLAEIKSLAESSSDARTFAKQLITQAVVTRWQATQLFNGFSQFNLGKYRLLDQIGVGRIGREFLAAHVHLGKRVAIKLVSRTLTTDPARLKKFLADARQAMGLDHPHLVHSYDVDQEGQRYYVVTEFVDGEDLRRRVERNGPCSLAEAVGFISQAAEGLQHAALSGVLHGDLKPSNLLVDKQGSLKVADLGFAQLVDGAPNTSGSKDPQEQDPQDGIEYCAPESLNHVEGDLDCRSDMFSLGQTLYFLLTGKTPPAPVESSLDRSSTLLATKSANQQVASVYATFTSPQASDRPATWKQAIEILRSLDVKSMAATPLAANGTAAKRKPPVAKAIPLPEADTTPVESLEPDLPSADEPPTAEAPAFVIKTDDSVSGRTRSQAIPVIPSDAPAAEPAAAKVSKAAKSKKLDPRLVLGVGIGGGLLLLLVSVLGLWMLLGGGENPEKVAEKSKEKNQANSTNPVSKPAEKNNDDEENPEEKNPEPEKPEPMATVGAEKPVAVPEPKPEPKPEPQPEPKPEPTVPAPEPVAPKPEPTVPAPEPPKVEPKPEPAPPKPAGKAFEKMPAVVSLPEPSQTEVTTLGEMSIRDLDMLRILMHGGEGATKNKMSFSLQNANAETDERNWEVVLNKVIVAKLHREPDKLTFEWTPDAAGQASSPCLGNCLLQLTTPTDEHFLALRTPVEEEPITLDLEKGSNVKFNIENLPSSTTVELVGLDPTLFPNPDFKTETVGRAKGQVMWYGDSLDSRNLGLLIEKKDASKKIDVNLEAYFRTDPLAKDAKDAEKINKRLLPDKLRFWEQQLNFLTQKGTAIDKLPAEQKEQKETAKNLNNVDLERGREQLGRIAKAVELAKKAHHTAKIHVRVYYDTGFGKVILAQTNGAPPPEPLGKPAVAAPAENK